MDVENKWNDLIFDDYFRVVELVIVTGLLVLLIVLSGKHFTFDTVVELINIPVLVGILLEILQANRRIKRQDHIRQQQLAKLETHLEAVLGFSIGDITPLRIIKELGHASAKINAAQVDKIWKSLTRSLTTRYRATNYIDYQHMYGNDGAKSIIAMQRAKMLGDEVDVEKVFILDKSSELDSKAAQETIALHRAAAIPTRYIVKSDIHKKLGNKCQLTDDKMDFAIFDDSVVLRWHFDAERKIGGGELLFGKDEIRPYQEFFELLHDVAKPI
ncbi:MAG TPA: hypothetical protein VGK97_11165 [Spongiibacteraceae bacterium]